MIGMQGAEGRAVCGRSRRTARPNAGFEHSAIQQDGPMPRLAQAAAAALLLIIPAAADAQDGIGLRGGLAVGANLPNDEFADGAKTGLVFQGWAGVGLGGFGLRGELHYSRSDLDSPLIRRAG